MPHPKPDLSVLIDLFKSSAKVAWGKCGLRSRPLPCDHHFADAEKLQHQVIAVGSRVLGREHSDVLKCMNGLAGNDQREVRYAEAEKLEREALETERRVLGPDDPEKLESMNNLGETLQSEGHYAEAEKLQRETPVVVSRVFGPTHPNTP